MERKNLIIGLLCAVGTALCWAILAIVLKYALNFSDSGSIVWLRMLVAFSLLFSLQLLVKPQHTKILLSPPLAIIIASLCLAFNYFSYMKGVELTTASNTQIMIQLGPLTLALFGIFYFKERPSKIQIFGFSFATIGFALFYWDQILMSLGNQQQFIVGNLWILAAALTWAAFAIIQKQWSNKISPQQINLVVYLVSTVALFFFADLNNLLNLSVFELAVLIFLGINTLVAYGCLGEALKRAPASLVSLIITLNPLLTIFLIQFMNKMNWLFIEYEPISWKGYCGALFVVSGLAMCLSLKPKSN